MFPRYIDWNYDTGEVRRLMEKHRDKSEEAIAFVINRKAIEYEEKIKELKIARGSWTGTDWHRIVNTEARGQDQGARMETKKLYRSVSKTRTYSPELGVWEVQFGIPTVEGGGERYFEEQEAGFDLELASGETRFVPGIQSSTWAINQISKEIRKDFLRNGFLRGKGSDKRGERILDLSSELGFERAYKTEYEPSDAQKESFQAFVERGRQIAAQRSAALASRNAARDAAIIERYGSLANFASRRFDR